MGRLRLLLATRNPGKARELASVLREAPVELVSLAELGLEGEVSEEGQTFEENVAAKALAYARLSGMWALADDSGLEVEALGGEPGVRSRRYAGEGASDPERIALLLRRLEGVPWERRDARFRCVIAIASPQGQVYFARGEVRGKIAMEPAGSGGFGYDPVFYLPELGRTVAQLPLEEKNAISHRGRAARQAVQLLRELARKVDCPPAG